MIPVCTDLAVSMSVMQHIVRVESSGNPFAIGVVKGKLRRQPRNLAEAVATAKMLEQKGFNFSVGIAQINRHNLKHYGLHSYEQAFQVCPNLKAGAKILRECYGRSKHWGKAFSCYYSGNFVTGYRHGYVQKVFASMRRSKTKPALLLAHGKKMPDNHPAAVPDTALPVAEKPPLPTARFARSGLPQPAAFPKTGTVEITPQVYQDDAFVF